MSVQRLTRRACNSTKGHLARDRTGTFQVRMWGSERAYSPPERCQLTVALSLSCWHRKHLVHKEEHVHCGGGEAPAGTLGKAAAHDKWVWNSHAPTNPLPQGLTDGVPTVCQCWGNDSEHRQALPRLSKSTHLEFSLNIRNPQDERRSI